MTKRTDRRTDHARRRRVELLIARVHSARQEIVGRGLDAVHGSRSRDESAAPGPAAGDVAADWRRTPR